MEHGKSSGYTNGGCRCDACSEAQRVYYAAWRAAKRPQDATEHGYEQTYNDYKCRCDACRAAATAARRRRRRMRGAAGTRTPDPLGANQVL
jgi:hypothetical protein